MVEALAVNNDLGDQVPIKSQNTRMQRVVSDQYLSQIAYRIAYDNYLWNYQRLAPDVRKAFIQQGANDLRAKQADGYYNPEFFEPYQQLNHDALMKDVDAFDKAYPKTPSLPAKAWYYFKLGGPSALASILRR